MLPWVGLTTDGEAVTCGEEGRSEGKAVGLSNTLSGGAGLRVSLRHPIGLVVRCGLTKIHGNLKLLYL